MTIIKTCKDDKPNQPSGCLFFNYEPVCGSDGQTYKNAECAKCNGLGSDEVAPNACGSQTAYEPCDSVQCPDNAECSRDVADCDFSDSLCGWVSQGDAKLMPVKAESGVPDHTGEDNGGYLVVSAGAGEARLVSAPLDTSARGFDCQISFYARASVSNDDKAAADLRLTLDYSSGVEPELLNLTPRLKKDTWSHILHRLDPRQQGTVNVTIAAAVPAGGGKLYLDDIDLRCGEYFVGDCACTPGYINAADDGQPVVCKVDPFEATPTPLPVPAGIDTCPDVVVGNHEYPRLCRAEESRPVCGKVPDAAPGEASLLLYKNAYCAGCNGVKDFILGLCPSNGTLPDVEAVGQCDKKALEKDPGLAGIAKLCDPDAADVENVCVDGVTYANINCAYCNLASRNISPGSCNDIVAPRPRPLRTCSGDMNIENYEQLAANCRSTSLREDAIVCAGNNDYANYWCAACNGFGKDEFTSGRCDALNVPMVSTCSDGSTAQCRWFVPDPVCVLNDKGKLVTYINPSW
jgi:hypothetical protein